MRNRAMCKLCNTVIETHFDGDYIACECGEIAVYGGLGMYSEAKDYNNFLRIDEAGNKIVVKYDEQPQTSANDSNPQGQPEKLTKEQLIDMLDTLIKNFEELPEHVLYSPVNHADLVSFMLVISNILKRGE